MSSKLAKRVNASSINKENWQDKKKKLKIQFPNLSDSELNFEEGKMEDLITRLHIKIGKTLGKTKESLHKYLELL